MVPDPARMAHVRVPMFARAGCPPARFLLLPFSISSFTDTRAHLIKNAIRIIIFKIF